MSVDCQPSNWFGLYFLVTELIGLVFVFLEFKILNLLSKIFLGSDPQSDFSHDL